MVLSSLGVNFWFELAVLAGGNELTWFSIKNLAANCIPHQQGCPDIS